MTPPATFNGICSSKNNVETPSERMGTKSNPKEMIAGERVVLKEGEVYLLNVISIHRIQCKVL
jgi:hypothetical protein